MANGHGGVRAGQGRPHGSKTTTSRAAVLARMQATGQLVLQGELPHEFLLRVSRGELILHGTKLVKIKKGKKLVEVEVPNYILPEFELRVEAAHKAAPYFAPRLTSIEVIRSLKDDQLDELIKQFAPQAGINIAIGGEGAQTAISITTQPPSSAPAVRPRLLAHPPA